jgi:small ligand-binding sensory domain FIST
VTEPPVRFGGALSLHPLPAAAAGEIAGELLDRFGGESPDLLVLFASPHHLGALEDELVAIHEICDPRVAFGGTAVAVAGGSREVEDQPALSAFAARWDDASVTAVRLRLEDTPDGPTIAGWPDDPDAADAHTLLLFADPFSFPADSFVARIHQDRPELTVIGGLASAAQGPGGNRLVSGRTVVNDGAVGVLIGGNARVDAVVSQGCRPIGEPFTVTRADGNLVRELGGSPPMDRFRATIDTLADEDRALLRNGLHVGLVVEERNVDFEPGDFLVRNVLGADRETGAIAVGAPVHAGQVLQFHVRDARSADDDLRLHLATRSARGALLFTCNGRGTHLFHHDDHDTGVIEELLGPVPLAGAFCAGEIGPVGRVPFLHGFTASIALFS